MPDEPPFNPLDKRNLGVSVAQALLARPVLPLAALAPFTGAAVPHAAYCPCALNGPVLH
ncbi:MAG: hypothetical protein M3Z04_08970 [Chloroflexota bacterium]|nr:hypothetical protein [Chloroflexota bacterium]